MPPRKKAAAKKKSKSTAVVDWSQYENTGGWENVDQADLGLPMLSICQSNSPEFDPSADGFEQKAIDGINVGDIFNIATREIVATFKGNPLEFIPCYYQKLFVEWRPRGGEGVGGFVQNHKDPRILARTQRQERPSRDVIVRGEGEGNWIVTTAYFVGFIRGDYKNPVILALKSTQLKKSRNLLKMMNAKRGSDDMPLPFFSHYYELEATPEKNKDGSWMGWLIKDGGPVTEQEDDIDALVDLHSTCKSSGGPMALEPPSDDAPSHAADEEDTPY
jgi:hypothetical protein